MMSGMNGRRPAVGVDDAPSLRGFFFLLLVFMERQRSGAALPMR